MLNVRWRERTELTWKKRGRVENWAMRKVDRMGAEGVV